MNTRRLPRLRDEPIPRPRLIDALQFAHEKRCIAMVAPAGAGKSALLRSWSRKARTARVQMILLTPRDGSLAEPLLHHCMSLHPDLAQSLQDRLPAREEDALREIAVALVRREGPLARPLVFVFDQLHELQNPADIRGMQPLLDYCPARVQCVFAARTALALSLGRLRDHDELLELEPGDFLWSTEEAQALFRAQVGDVEQPRLPQWFAQTEGWSTGLLSVCNAIRSGRADEDVLADAFGFLDAEVLVHLAPDQATLFESLAAVQIFDVEFVSRQARCTEGQARTLLESFAATTGFVRPAPEQGWWRFHETLAILLRRRFAARPASDRRQVHRRASSHFSERGLRWHAVNQAVLAGDSRRAAGLVEGWASNLFQDGLHDELAALVRLVPPEAAAGSLQPWTALLALLEHRYEECQALLLDLERVLEKDDVAMQRRVRVLKGWLAMFRDDMESAVAAFPASEKMDDDAGVDEVTLAGERNAMCWIHIYRNDYQRARDLQVDAQSTADRPTGTLFGSLSGRCLAGLSMALEGGIASAEGIYREVLAQSQARGASCIDPAVLAAGLLGETLYELNDLEGVLALQPQLPQLQRRSLPDPFLRVVLAMLRAHALYGRIDEAMRHSEILEAVSRERGLPRLLSYALFERIRLHLLRQDPDAARPAWNELADLRQLYETDVRTALGEVSMVADRAEIMLLFYRGRLEQVRGQIDKLLQLSQRRGRHRRVAALRFQRAAVDHELGDAKAANEQAFLGLQLGAQLGLVRSLVDAHPSVPLLLDGAMALYVDDVGLAFHADRLRAAAGEGPLTPFELGARDRGCPTKRQQLPGAMNLSEREEQIAQLLVLAMPNKEIARVLGLSAETVKWHLHNLFSKLGVTTRYGAASAVRARDHQGAERLSSGQPGRKARHAGHPS